MTPAPPGLLRELTSAAEVLAATGDDPYCRGTLRSPQAVGWTDGRAAAWHGIDAEERVPWVGVHGAPGDAAALMAPVGPLLPPRSRVTLPRGAPQLLPEPWSMTATDWDFRWTVTPPPAQPGEELVSWLDDDAAVRALLSAASPTASALPGDPAVQRWCGLRSGGRLLAVAADTSGAPGVGHLSSIAVAVEERGRGLGAAVTAWLTRRLLEEVPLVTLGMYATNVAGRAMYDRLGYADEHRFSSGLLLRDGEPLGAAAHPHD